VDFRRSTEIPVPEELVARARASALAAGYAQGWAQGQHDVKAAATAADARIVAAEQARAGALERAVGAVLAAADALSRRSAPTVVELEDTVLRSAVDLAEALLGRALADSADPGGDALRRALSVAPDGGTVTVRLHPDDLAALDAPHGDYVLGGRTVTLRPDPALTPGDAVAEQGTTSIDARLAEAVRRVRQELGR
jgi:flagellar assembly protein FliH